MNKYDNFPFQLLHPTQKVIFRRLYKKCHFILRIDYSTQHEMDYLHD